MARDTERRKRVVESEVETIEGKEYNIKNTRYSDGREGVVAWTSENVIIVAQINDNQQTSCNESTSMETVEPDYLDEYVQSMLDNGWTIKEGLNMVYSDDPAEDEGTNGAGALDQISDISKKIREKLVGAGFDTIELLQNASKDDLTSIAGIGEITADKILTAVK